jgi:hypothetical protein
MSTSTDADFTLTELWEKGVPELTDEQHIPNSPGTTYEAAPGIVGQMTWPTLEVQNEVREINSQLQDLFKEDATADQFEALTTAATEGEGLEAEESPVKDGVTVADFDPFQHTGVIAVS